MKKNFYFMMLLFIGSILFSCKTTRQKAEQAASLPEKAEPQPAGKELQLDNVAYPNEFEASHKTWLDFKKSTKNSYKYSVIDFSWVGFKWETTITVENGIVKERSFKYTSTKGLPQDIPENELEWIETGNKIGANQNGAKPLTLDEVYDNAQKEWLIKRENAQTYFKTENNGMISTCGYVENNCADDCFRGIAIENIEAL